MYNGAAEVPLSGAVLRLVVHGTTTRAKDVNGNDLPDRTTGADGAAGLWTGIPKGTYDILEITAPTGYQLPANNVLHTFTIDKDHLTEIYNPDNDSLIQDPNATHQYYNTNMPIYGSVGVKKVRSDDANEKLDGVKFELLVDNNGAPGTTRAKNLHGQETPVVTTGSYEAGSAVWADIEFGSYWIHEISTIDGFYLDPNASTSYKKVTISTQNEFPVIEFKDGNIAQEWEVEVYKSDNLTKDPVAGATFKIE